MFVKRSMKLKYVNEIGTSIEMSFFSTIMLTGVSEGIKNNIESEPETSAHGYKYIASKMDKRYITLSGVLRPGADPFRLSGKIRKAFNPTLSGALFHITESGERMISCRVEEVPPIKKVNGIFVFEVDLLACQPFWQESKERSEYLALLTKNLNFPLCIPLGGMCFGIRRPSLQAKIVNIGDVESGFRVAFSARGGSVINPQLINKATGERIKIYYVMQKDELIEVINYPELKKIIINGNENGFKFLDIGSVFFNLQVGDNLIGYQADENTINLDVAMFYTPRFMGAD